MTYPKLRGAIREKFGTQAAFAKAISMHSTTLSGKLSGRRDWTRQEIEDAALALEISTMEISEYFFTR